MTSNDTTAMIPDGSPVCSTKEASMTDLSRKLSGAKKTEKNVKDAFDFDDDSTSSFNSDNGDAQVQPLPTTLTPGLCLEACSGSDIQLARGATARPNLAKGRGRFLIVLPGLLSLKPPKTRAPLERASDAGHVTTQSQETNVSLSQNTDAILMSQATEPSAQMASEGDKKSRIGASLLGRIEGLATDDPVLKIPHPNGKCLVLQGKKMESQTKFMMLTCKSSKESVTCKDVFSSMIVFGEPLWEEQANSAKSKLPNDDGDDDDNLICLGPNDSPFHHYGGSERTVDGKVSKSSKVRKSAPKKPKISTKPKTTVDDESDDDAVVDIDADDSNESEVVPAKIPAETNDDDDFSFNGIVSDVPVETKNRPRRSTASRTKVKYTQSEESENDSDDAAGNTQDDNDENESSDGVEVIEPVKKRPRRSRSSRAKVKHTQSEESDNENDQGSEEPDEDDSEVEVVDLDDDNSEEEFEPTKRKKPRPTPSKKKGGKS